MYHALVNGQGEKMENICNRVPCQALLGEYLRNQCKVIAFEFVQMLIKGFCVNGM